MDVDVLLRKHSGMRGKKGQSKGVKRESETKITESMLCGPAATVELKSGGRRAREKEARE